ncbi:uncharacterized protein LOC142570993 isoform X1 [Dermacentor variabilis]|uniref:uncharacterized protein LOC142570993 isoform X1 n=2 Tax=Dermacentor variabilis TaxID=34621 RepID=UPI003F5BA98E
MNFVHRWRQPTINANTCMCLQMVTVLKSPFADAALDFHKNFGGYILEHLRLNPRSKWINATSHEEQTYGELADQVVAVHAALESLGVCAGDRLCLIVANRLELLPMLVGAACANVGVAYECPGYAVDVLTEKMKDIQFTAICCETSDIDSALELKARLPTIKHIIFLGETTTVPPDGEGAVVSWSELIRMGTDACRLAAPSVEYQVNRICYMNSTSGTTGKPKMVVHCHDSLVASLQANSHRQHMGLTVEDVLLCTGTLGHVYALFDCACKAIVQGATCAFLEKGSADALLEALQRFKVSALSTVPYLARCLLDHPQRSHYDLSRLQYVATGSNYISEHDAKRLFHELHLKSYIQMYGQTEIVFVAGGLHDSSPRFASIGRLGMGLEAMIIDTETRKPLGPMQHGELVVRGPGLMRGYWGRLDESYTDAEGWYGTGDECYFDHEGWLYLVQRLSEFIYCRSIKMAPADIEAVLLQCVDVKDCAVVGLPHPQAGQLPHAVIVPKKKSRHLDLEHYIRFVNERVPKQLQLEGGATLVDSIPRNKIGKLVRQELVSWLLQLRTQNNLK